jgi:8-oxo-dGTP pyrophosphatase MutT (NUDIX family)
MPDRVLAPWPRLSEKVLGRFRIFDIVEEEYERPDGAPSHSFYVLRTSDWVNVVPVTPEGRVVLIRQFRPGTQEITIEVPGGMVEPSEPDPAASALRELEEETGYVADSIALTASIRPNPAILRNRLHMFVATGARPSGRVNLDAGEDVESFEATWDEIDGMVRRREITHALTLTALMYARYVR